MTRDLAVPLAESDIARVVLERTTIYPAGRVLDIAATVDAPRDLHGDDELRLWRNETLALLRPADGTLPAALLRISVRLSNGRTATFFDDILAPESKPDRPVLRDISGAGYLAKGNHMSFRPRLWLWPAVTDRYEIVVEWPAFGIPVTTVALD